MRAARQGQLRVPPALHSRHAAPCATILAHLLTHGALKGFERHAHALTSKLGHLARRCKLFSDEQILETALFIVGLPVLKHGSAHARTSWPLAPCCKPGAACMTNRLVHACYNILQGCRAEHTGAPECAHRLASAPNGESARERSALGAAERAPGSGAPQACSSIASSPGVLHHLCCNARHRESRLQRSRSSGSAILQHQPVGAAAVARQHWCPDLKLKRLAWQGVRFCRAFRAPLHILTESSRNGGCWTI